MGMSGMNLVIVLAVVVIAASAVFIAATMDKDGVSKVIIDGDDGVLLGGSCEVEPYIALNVVNELASGTSVVPTIKGYDTDTDTSLGTITEDSSGTVFSVGDAPQLLVSNVSYFDEIVVMPKMKCGANKLNMNLKENTSLTLQVYEESTLLSDDAAGGTNNGSTVAAGGTENFNLRVNGQGDKGTGEIYWIMELSKATNVSDVVMTDSSGAELKELIIEKDYADTLTAPFKKAYLIPNKDESGERRYEIEVQARTGYVIAGAFYMTGYQMQPFEDADGTFKEPGDLHEDGERKIYIYDSDGTGVSLNTADYDIFLIDN